MDYLTKKKAKDSFLPNCKNCKHYFITYQPQAPHGCRLFKLQSMKMPHLIIKNESGQHCNGFDKK